MFIKVVATDVVMERRTILCVAHWSKQAYRVKSLKSNIFQKRLILKLHSINLNLSQVV